MPDQGHRGLGRPRLKQILGPDSEDLIVTEDPVQDRNTGMAFSALARQKSEVIPDAKNPDRAILIVGPEDWPAPFPIVRRVAAGPSTPRPGDRRS